MTEEHRNPLQFRHRLEQRRYLEAGNGVVIALMKRLQEDDLIGDGWEAMPCSEQNELSGELTCLAAETMLVYFEKVNN